MKNKYRIKALILLLSLGIGAASVCPINAHAATENDLRYVMGIGRLDAKSIKTRINRFSERLALDNSYNEMVSYVKENGLETDVTEDHIKKETSSYKDLIRSVQSGRPVSDIKKALSRYDDYAIAGEDTFDTGTTFDYTDTTRLKQKLKELKALKAIEKNRTNIGGVSNRLPTITKKPMHIASMGNNAVRFDTGRKQKIYCLFSGRIINITKHDITIASGETIQVTYKGLKPCVRSGSKIKQGSLIGRAAGTSIKIDMVMNGKSANIVTAFGKEGKRIYEDYMSENPWSDIRLNVNRMKCTDRYEANIRKKKKKNENVTGYYYDNGEKRYTTADIPKTSDNNNLFSGDPFDDDNTDNVTAEKGTEK